MFGGNILYREQSATLLYPTVVVGSGQGEWWAFKAHGKGKITLVKVSEGLWFRLNVDKVKIFYLVPKVTCLSQYLTKIIIFRLP